MTWKPDQALWDEAERKAQERQRRLNGNGQERADVVMLSEYRREHGAAQSTIDALMYSLRRGLAALGSSDPLQKDTVRRLSELTETQINDCRRALANRNPAWTEDELAKLVSAWKGVRQ